MQIETPEILWHSRESVLSIDIHPASNRLATGGADKYVRIWQLEVTPERKANVVFLAEMDLHESSVNVVRFSPDGTLLASGSDDRNILLWKKTDEQPAAQEAGSLSTTDQEQKEVWKRHGMCRGHLADIYDLAWSPTGTYMVSASMDNAVMVWDTTTAKCVQQLQEHTHCVQGVACDPLFKLFASQSSDRSLRIYTANTPRSKTSVPFFTCRTHNKSRGVDKPAGGSPGRKKDKEKDGKDAKEAAPANASSSSSSSSSASQASADPLAVTSGMPAAGPSLSALAAADQSAEQGKQQAATAPTTPTKSTPDKDEKDKEKKEKGPKKSHIMYMDETVPSFFRRLTFSPDGSFLITPTGQYEPIGDELKDLKPGAPPPKPQPCSFIYHRSNLKKPVMYLASQEPTICVRFCPTIFALRNPKVRTFTDLDYRMVFAVATTKQILLYDTEVMRPIAALRSIHYQVINDLAWSSDGLTLSCASKDGYCTFILFKQGELGTPLAGDERKKYDEIMDDERKATLKKLEVVKKGPKKKTAAAAAAGGAQAGQENAPQSDEKKAKPKSKAKPKKVADASKDAKPAAVLKFATPAAATQAAPSTPSASSVASAASPAPATPVAGAAHSGSPGSPIVLSPLSPASGGGDGDVAMTVAANNPDPMAKVLSPSALPAAAASEDKDSGVVAQPPVKKKLKLSPPTEVVVSDKDSGSGSGDESGALLGLARSRRVYADKPPSPTKAGPAAAAVLNADLTLAAVSTIAVAAVGAGEEKVTVLTPVRSKKRKAEAETPSAVEPSPSATVSVPAVAVAASPSVASVVVAASASAPVPMSDEAPSSQPQPQPQAQSSSSSSSSSAASTATKPADAVVHLPAVKRRKIAPTAEPPKSSGSVAAPSTAPVASQSQSSAATASASASASAAAMDTSDDFGSGKDGKDAKDSKDGKDEKQEPPAAKLSASAKLLRAKQMQEQQAMEIDLNDDDEESGSDSEEEDDDEDEAGEGDASEGEGDEQEDAETEAQPPNSALAPSQQPIAQPAPVASPASSASSSSSSSSASSAANLPAAAPLVVSKKDKRKIAPMAVVAS